MPRQPDDDRPGRSGRIDSSPAGSFQPDWPRPDSRQPDSPRAGSPAPGSRRAAKGAIAVALEYDLDSGHAPKVVATGRGALADSILALAFASGVRVREDADLAELLSLVDLGDEIPCEAFLAVAEVLRYVYQANGTLSSEGPPA